MTVWLAVRNGRSWLIPRAYGQRYRSDGFRLFDAPAGAPVVEKPTMWEQKGASEAVVASPPEQPRPKRKRGRPRKKRA